MFHMEIQFVGNIEKIMVVNSGSDLQNACTLVMLRLRESQQWNQCRFQLCCKLKGCLPALQLKWFFLLAHHGVLTAWFEFILLNGKNIQNKWEMYAKLVTKTILVLQGTTISLSYLIFTYILIYILIFPFLFK